MTAIINSAALNGFKIVNQIMNNEYVQLATQNLSVDFIMVALLVEARRLIKSVY